MLGLQKASMWKRISAFFLDAILLSVVVALFAYLMTIAFQFDRYNDILSQAYATYGEKYGVSFHMSLSEYESMTEDYAKQLDAAYQAMSQDEAAVGAYNMLIQLTLLITSLSILMGYVVMEYTVPLLFQNGQTLGKKLFGIAVMQTEGVRVNAKGMFIRVFLGKYTLETMVPVMILLMMYFGSLGLTGTIVLLLLVVLQLVLLCATHTHSLIHDLLAGTVVVDLASQMIFDSREALIAYKERQHAEKVAHQAS